jgi:uncharacterized membrane protein
VITQLQLINIIIIIIVITLSITTNIGILKSSVTAMYGVTVYNGAVIDTPVFNQNSPYNKIL